VCGPNADLLVLKSVVRTLPTRL